MDSMKTLMLLRFAKVAFEDQYKFVFSIVGGSGISSTSTQTCWALRFFKRVIFIGIGTVSSPGKKSSEEEVLDFVSLLQKGIR